MSKQTPHDRDPWATPTHASSRAIVRKLFIALEPEISAPRNADITITRHGDTITLTATPAIMRDADGNPIITNDEIALAPSASVKLRVLENMLKEAAQ